MTNMNILCIKQKFIIKSAQATHFIIHDTQDAEKRDNNMTLINNKS